MHEAYKSDQNDQKKMRNCDGAHCCERKNRIMKNGRRWWLLLGRPIARACVLAFAAAYIKWKCNVSVTLTAEEIFLLIYLMVTHYKIVSVCVWFYFSFYIHLWDSSGSIFLPNTGTWLGECHIYFHFRSTMIRSHSHIHAHAHAHRLPHRTSSIITVQLLNCSSEFSVQFGRVCNNNSPLFSSIRCPSLRSITKHLSLFSFRFFFSRRRRWMRRERAHTHKLTHHHCYSETPKIITSSTRLSSRNDAKLLNDSFRSTKQPQHFLRNRIWLYVFIGRFSCGHWPLATHTFRWI